MDLKSLKTESRNPDTMDIDMLDTENILKKINNEDKKVALAVESELPHVAKAVDMVVQSIRHGGRVFYVGAGTSGRLGTLDASECPPTYGVSPELFQGVIAGGTKALYSSIEGAEDDRKQGKTDLIAHNVTGGDIVVGIAASGRTPYALGAMEYGRGIGCGTVGIACNKGSEMEGLADVMIAPEVGPEAVTGSTRMKAGTAQKMVLNMISTASMIKLGKVYTNLMVDMKPSNEKLKARAINIVRIATDSTEESVKTALEESGNNVKTAILMLLKDITKEQAGQELKKADGFIRKAI